MNTEERQRLQRNARLRADAGVCPQQTNTQEKTLATADLVRDTAFINQELSDVSGAYSFSEGASHLDVPW